MVSLNPLNNDNKALHQNSIHIYTTACKRVARAMDYGSHDDGKLRG